MASGIDEAVANFHGHEPRECGEHRTVGPHRAWCFDCQEWCYPSEPCVRCMNPDALRAERDEARAQAAALRGALLAVLGCPRTCAVHQDIARAARDAASGEGADG